MKPPEFFSLSVHVDPAGTTASQGGLPARGVAVDPEDVCSQLTFEDLDCVKGIILQKFKSYRNKPSH